MVARIQEQQKKPDKGGSKACLHTAVRMFSVSVYTICCREKTAPIGVLIRTGLPSVTRAGPTSHGRRTRLGVASLLGASRGPMISPTASSLDEQSRRINMHVCPAFVGFASHDHARPADAVAELPLGRTLPSEYLSDSAKGSRVTAISSLSGLVELTRASCRQRGVFRS